ncbi:hypothetical protein DN402_06305 [Streptomyces sp. SW4]|nr:hypothetical protein DN402_06305 [Streptomyces sp. SW4]
MRQRHPARVRARPAHRDPVDAPAVQPDPDGVVGRDLGARPGPRPARRHRGQPGQQRVRRVGGDGRPVLQVGAPGGQRERDVDERGLLAALAGGQQEVPQAARGRGERGRRARRQERHHRALPGAGLGGVGGGPSTTMCALPPPAPKELMPARSGRPVPSRVTHGATSCCTANGTRSKSISGLAGVACSDGTRVRCRSWSSTLASATAPAADSRWPTLDFTEPMGSSPGPLTPSRANAVARPRISMGSPSAVPVPCVSM